MSRKHRNGSDRKPKAEPVPFCSIHGCERKAVNTCTMCGVDVCGYHIQACALCPDCDRGQIEQDKNARFVDVDDDGCPFCGQDECDCHDTIMGFPEGCSKD